MFALLFHLNEWNILFHSLYILPSNSKRFIQTESAHTYSIHWNGNRLKSCIKAKNKTEKSEWQAGTQVGIYV